jgi:hypothetical protein
MFRRCFSSIPLNLIVRNQGNYIQIGKRNNIVNHVKSTSDQVLMLNIVNPDEPLSNLLEVQKRFPNMELVIEFRHAYSQMAWFFPEYYHIKFNQDGEIELIEDVTPDM